MTIKISDGKGKGNLAGVTSKNKLLTLATVESRAHSAAELGQTFFLTTDLIPLSTSGSEHGFLYIQNTSTDKHIHIEQIRLTTDGLVYFRLYKGNLKNIMSGTLISSGAGIDPENTNFSIERSLEVTATKGADGDEVGGGRCISQVILTDNTTEMHIDFTSLLLARNDHIALTAVVTSNISIGASLTMYYDVEGEG